MSIDESALAKERDEKFKKWLQDKTLRDKAFDYLRKLDKCRAEKEDSLKEVAVCLLAVDRLMGNDDVGGGDEGDENEPDNNKKVCQLSTSPCCKQLVHFNPTISLSPSPLCRCVPKKWQPKRLCATPGSSGLWSSTTSIKSSSVLQRWAP